MFSFQAWLSTQMKRCPYREDKIGDTKGGRDGGRREGVKGGLITYSSSCKVL